ncbi:MAG: preprotein translocase subunit SecG [Bacteroidales bacterium]|nr:preprotein translocase subunit SecG [Bacteroidales bacterium]
MNALFTTLTVFVVIAAILLILVVLLQNGKGQGMASNFVAANQTLGVRQTADILEKITWGLVVFIIVVSVVASFTTGTAKAGLDVSDKIENAASGEAAFPGVVEGEVPSIEDGIEAAAEDAQN